MHSDLAESQGRDGARPAGVTHVHFTVSDLGRTRFPVAPAPLMEAVMGLLELRAGPRGIPGNRWLARARRDFPLTARPLLALTPWTASLPHFLHPLTCDVDEGLEQVRATPRKVLREELGALWQGSARPPEWLRVLADGDAESLEMLWRGLRDFHTACIAPYWPAMVASFHANVTQHLPVLATGGLAGLFGGLHESLSWQDGTLQRAGRTGEFWLDGSGMYLMSTALWSGPPLLTFTAIGGSALIYPARRSPGPLINTPARDLDALMGRTRAAALRALHQPCGTADLAARLGISAPSASEHVTKLRKAGLVQTRRRGHGVWHSLTPLGRSLLNGP